MLEGVTIYQNYDENNSFIVEGRDINTNNPNALPCFWLDDKTELHLPRSVARQLTRDFEGEARLQLMQKLMRVCLELCVNEEVNLSVNYMNQAKALGEYNLI